MRELVVTPEQFGPAVARMFDELERQNRAAAIKALQRAAYLCQAEAVRQIGLVQPYQPVDTGELKRSYRVQATPDGAILENVAPHAVFVEFGTRPHWAPLAPLLAWATRKQRGGKDKSAMALARGAQRSIAKRGTRARGFHAAASLKFPGIVEEQLRFALDKLASGGR